MQQSYYERCLEDNRYWKRHWKQFRQHFQRESVVFEASRKNPTEMIAYYQQKVGFLAKHSLCLPVEGEHWFLDEVTPYFTRNGKQVFLFTVSQRAVYHLLLWKHSSAPLLRGPAFLCSADIPVHKKLLFIPSLEGEYTCTIDASGITPGTFLHSLEEAKNLTLEYLSENP